MIRNISISLLSLLIALGLAESLTRLLAPHPRYPEFTIPNEKVGYLYVPRTHGRATNMFGEFDTDIQINSEGFRDTDHPLVKPPHTLRIAFIGDSFTFAEQTEEKGTFVRRTETLLNEKLSKEGHSPDSAQDRPLRVEVMNFGVGGYDSYQEVLMYENFVRKYRPDWVVLAMYVGNDIIGNVFYMVEEGFGRPYFRLENGSLRQVPADMAVMEKNHEANEHFSDVRWYQHSQFYNTLRQIFWEFRQQKRLNKERLAAGKIPPLERDLEKIWKVGVYRNYRYYFGDGNDRVVAEANAVTKLLMRKLESEITADGGKFFVAQLPAAENIWPEKWPERVKQLPSIEGIPMDFDRPFKMIKDWLPESVARGEVLDLRPALKEAHSAKPVFFRRDNHYTPAGQEAVGKALARWLDQKLRIKNTAIP